MELPEWEAVNNGAGSRPWFIQRKGADRGNWPGGSDLWYLYTADGSRLVRFKNHETAQRRVDKLNKGEGRRAL